ncbi:MAG: hypothetical protein P8Y70_01735 [Candidatus Lokiarchaeota archaeon]
MNLETILGYNDFDSDKKYSVDLNNGKGYVDLNLKLSLMNGDSYKVVLKANVYSSGDISVIGITNITLNFRVVNRTYIINQNYAQPVTSLSKRIETFISSQQTVYSNGTIIMKFNESNTIITKSVNYSISHKLLLSANDLTYHVTYPLYWLWIFYIGVLIFFGFLLIRYGRPYFSKISNFPEDIKKRDELFVKYLHERNRELAGEDDEDEDNDEKED